MAKGFKDSKGKFRPTSRNSKSSKSMSTNPKGLKFKPTKERRKEEATSLLFQLEREKGKGKTTRIDLNIDPKTFLKAVENDPNWIPAHGADSVKNIKKRIEEGKPLDKPFLLILRNRRYKDVIFGHQGRHRAVTARELGVKKIPVEIYCKKGVWLANCRNVDEEVLRDAISQFTSRAEEQQQDKLRNEGWEQFRKELKKIEKENKHMTPDEEQQLFEAKFDVKKHDLLRKLQEDTAKKRDEKRKEIKEILSDG